MITDNNAALGIVTPGNSQEMASSDDEPILNEPSPDKHYIHSVVWIDTDSSEDEDYFPQNQHTLVPSPPRLDRKRSRSNSPEEESAGQKVRRAIDVAVDTGVDYVDLGGLGLAELPPEFMDVRYITVIKQDSVKNTALKLYLPGNLLTEFPSPLFALKNLSVLSLRSNQLKVLPPEIGLLQNLVEVSVGNNLLEYLPSELIELPRLTILCFTPNPFLPKESQPRQLCSVAVPSLVEMMSREFLKMDSAVPLHLPDELRDRLAGVSAMNVCHACRKRFCKAAVEQVVWQQVFGRDDIPTAYRFCSVHCSR